jgi:carboxypeptidase C (cathepsin A)
MNNNVPAAGDVRELPGYGVPRQRQLAGHLCVDEARGDYLFFWFFAAENPSHNTPLVLWLNGGPGASSMLGLFAENGPYKIREDLSLEENPYSWNKNAHYLVFDQPAGTGLSFVDPAKGTQGQIKTEAQATAQLLKGVVQFCEKWPEYRQSPWYIFGESFAGRYIPMLAHAILDHNATHPEPIPLTGIGIGDGWVAPLIQEATYPDYAYAQGLIDKQQREHAQLLYGQCALAVTQSGPVSSAESDKICNSIEAYIAAAAGGINVYDVRTTGDYSFPLIARYLNQPSLRNALHISSLVGPWEDTSSTVANNLERGEQDSAAHLFPRLFETLRVLIYNGIYDMDCNFMGTDNWLGTLHWPGSEAFNREIRRPWLWQNQLAGHARSQGNLTQLVIRNAGHLVPMDQPAVALGMLNTFLNNSPFCVAEK